MTAIESTGKKVEGKIDDELVKPGEGREPIVTLETNDTHAESGEGQAKGVNQSAAELFDDGDAVVSGACHDDLEVVCQLCVPPLEMEESFNLWALTDCVNDKLEKLRGRMAANLPNENEAELDKKLAKLKWWLGLIEQLRSGMLVAPEEPVDWEVLEFADEAMVDAAKRRHEKLIQWREYGSQVAPTSEKAEGGQVSGAQRHEALRKLQSGKRQRFDAMKSEILHVIKESGIPISEICAAKLWSLLVVRAGKPGSCIYDVNEEGLWVDDELSRGKAVKKKDVAKRLARLKKVYR
ncbi:hypothetical protein [Crenobacter intestini]|uniref:Uncharacterized protein n=1 Tax=Crenobacter intestini TaxID=2563443 RepID=A0A4T0V204_9NEIS|nr:hypothetical protein [Crenobacter intestini]TIC85186.1 hypothetical protein E5K04_04080 [Crenobacter intestini]